MWVSVYARVRVCAHRHADAGGARLSHGVVGTLPADPASETAGTVSVWAEAEGEEREPRGSRWPGRAARRSSALRGSGLMTMTTTTTTADDDDADLYRRLPRSNEACTSM